jgi:hypothetical protein
MAKIHPIFKGLDPFGIDLGTFCARLLLRISHRGDSKALSFLAGTASGVADEGTIDDSAASRVN